MRDTVLGLLRSALDRGQSIEIGGLGKFQRGADGYQFVAEGRPQVFIAYVEEDLARAKRLRDALEAAGFAPWMDKDQLLAGQNWPRAIERAIELSDAFVPCLSARSLSKRGQFQCELRYAMDCARRMPLDEVFLAPVRFEVCTVPPSLAASTQYVDLFPDFDRGVRQLVRALRKHKPALAGTIPLDLTE